MGYLNCVEVCWGPGQFPGLESVAKKQKGPTQTKLLHSWDPGSPQVIHGHLTSLGFP